MKRKVLKPNVVGGGQAIPIGNNFYYMQGRKHSQGGIDIGTNPKTGLEVEDGEVMHLTNKDVKVYSSVPFLRGKSPAQRVMGGENPTKVFNEQERYKKRKGINDDGSKKKAMGGVKETKPKFEDWYKTVPKEINDTTNYNLRRAYELLPYDELEYWKNGKGHLRSVAPTKDGNYEFLKSKNHPTYKKEIEWYNSNKGIEFRNEYKLDDSNEYPKYIKRKKFMGGKKVNHTLTKQELNNLNDREGMKVAKKDKPLENVYPEAILLPGLRNIKSAYNAYKNIKTAKNKHFWFDKEKSREDVINENKKSMINDIIQIVNPLFAMGGKTNNEELSLTRRQFRNGGLYSLTVDGETRMKQFPSTGKRTKAELGTVKRTPAEWKRHRKTPSHFSLEGLSIDADNRTFAYLNGWRPYIFKDDNKFTSATKPQLPTTIGIQPLHEFKAEPAKLPTPTLTMPDADRLKPVDVPQLPKKQSWLKRTMNKLGVEPNDVASLIPNIAGSFITHSINSKMLNNFKEPQAPIARQAVKLKTRINIEPQLDKMRESLAEYERQVDNNTASSNVALARKNNFRLANIMNTNALYADKENKETELINQDKLNRQSVIDANVRDYNDYLSRSNQYQNTIAEKKAENSVGLINNLNAGIQNVLGNIEKRKSEDRNLKAMIAAYPDLPIELFEKGDVITTNAGDWYRAGIGRNRRGMKKTV